MRILYNVITASVFCFLLGCSSPIDNSSFIPGPDGGDGPDTGEIIPDVVGTDQVKVISFNVRTATAGDKGANAWDKRRVAVKPLLTKENPTVFGVQEAVMEQVNYIKEQLPEYGAYGVGRDNGAEKGETMTIFYKKGLVSMDNYGTFWLSETPDEPSKGWEAAYIRTATWAEFTHIPTGKKFFYINTHLDNRAGPARGKSIELICSRLEELNPDGYPTIVTGDFNTDSSDPIFGLFEGKLYDAREAESTDSAPTFNNFGKTNSQSKLDHIFISDDGFKSLQFRTIRDRYMGVSYVSDHYPISALLEFK